MRICMLAEGSYPYVMGGVSSWIQTMISSSPEYEFIIYAIVDKKSRKGKYKYKIPSNVVGIIEVFLDDINIGNINTGRKYKITDDFTEAIKGLLNHKEINWNKIFEFFMKERFKNVSEFFMSKNFYEIVRELYREEYAYTPYTEFIWSIRSMYLALFHILVKPVPKADLYHSVSTGYCGVVGSYGKFLYNSAFILSEHGIYTREREEEIIKSDWIKGYHKDIWIKFFYSLSECAYENSDKVTSLFKVNKELQLEMGCKEEKIIIIPNGVDVEHYKNLPKKDKNDANINIGIIARVVPIKDIKTLLLSFNIVKKEIPHAKLYIMGPAEEDEKYFAECKSLIEKLEIKDVEFTGSINVLDYIGKMDILVLSSISEGQPLAVMEGMAAKKPHVCTNVGDCRGLLEGDNDFYGKCGFIERVMDYNGISQSMIKLCKSEKLRKEFGEVGYRRVKNLYTKKGSIDKYKALYESYGGKI